MQLISHLAHFGFLCSLVLTCSHSDKGFMNSWIFFLYKVCVEKHLFENLLCTQHHLSSIKSSCFVWDELVFVLVELSPLFDVLKLDDVGFGNRKIIDAEETWEYGVSLPNLDKHMEEVQENVELFLEGKTVNVFLQKLF